MAKEGEVFEESFNILEGLGNLEETFNQQPTEPVEETQDDDSPEGEEKDKDVDADAEDHSDEETEVEKEKEDTNSDNQEDKDKSSPLTPYAKYLKEEGVLPNIDIETFDGTADGLKQAMFDQIMQGVEEYKSMLPTEVQSIINNYEAGVPLDTLIKLNSEVVKYSAITDEQLSDVEFQKKIYTEFLSKTTRYSKERIDREVNRLAELQELEEEAKSAIQDLIVLQKEEEQVALAKAKEEQDAFEARRIQELEDLKTTIETTKEIVPGVELSKALKDKIYKNLTTPASYDQAGNPINKLGAYRAKNPIQTEIILNYLFEATNEFKDWSVFGKATKSKVFKELEAASASLDNKQQGVSVNRSKQSATTKSFLEQIDNFI